MITWINDNPYEAVVVIFFTYIITICIGVLPMLQLHYIISFSYVDVMGSKWKGLLVSVPIIFISCMTASTIAFLNAKYFFRKQVEKSLYDTHDQVPWLKNFILIDELFKDG